MLHCIVRSVKVSGCQIVNTLSVLINKVSNSSAVVDEFIDYLSPLP